MPEVAPVRTEKQTSPPSSSIETITPISRIGSSMKKEKSTTQQEQDRYQELANGDTDLKEIDTDQEHDHNDKDGSIKVDEPTIALANGIEDHDNHDVESTNASPALASSEQDTPMVERPSIRGSNGTGATEGISQEDLDGGLLDGALDDYDLDQDTEDTEVGNGEDDFSDDDDDDDDMDGKAGRDEAHSPNGMSLADTTNDRDMDTADESADHHDKGAATVHSEDSDSDLPDPEGSDNEHEDDDDEEEEEEEEEEEGEDADEEDGEDEDLDDEEEDEEPVQKAPEPKKDNMMSQKPTLNRPPATEEELKDSGDDLSDLSEFDDTDDSDEDDDVPETIVSNKESSTNSLSSAPVSTTPANGKPGPGGRKRSLHDTAKDTIKQVQESVKTEQDDQAEVPNGRARLMERKAPEAEEEHHSDKESSSEVPEEEEEDKIAEDDEEEEEEVGFSMVLDMETKQLHKDALEALTSIEVEFANLRDKIYEERMTELDREVEMINAGTHPELSSLMQEIEQKREQRLRFADMGKKYLIDIAQSAYHVAEYRAHCTYQYARRSTRSDLLRELGKKQQRLMMELTLSSDTNKRKVIDNKATLLRARKLRRLEAAELKVIVNEQRCFPGSIKLNTVTNSELNSDFAAMGLTRLLPQANLVEQVVHPSRTPGHMPPSMPIPQSTMSSRPISSNRWSNGIDYPPPPNMSQSGGYYGSRPEVEIYVDDYASKDRRIEDEATFKPL
ncbi:hypothetical protein BGX27_008954 [Mortierella sp. AM989]|nr:hypothetical protein BGX27_008954 [Mortierella sp. AM989]